MGITAPRLRMVGKIKCFTTRSVWTSISSLQRQPWLLLYLWSAQIRLCGLSWWQCVCSVTWLPSITSLQGPEIRCFLCAVICWDWVDLSPMAKLTNLQDPLPLSSPCSGTEVRLWRGHSGRRRPAAARQASDRPHQPAYPAGKSSHTCLCVSQVVAEGEVILFEFHDVLSCYALLIPFKTRTKRNFRRLFSLEILNFYFSIRWLIVHLSGYLSKAEPQILLNGCEVKKKKKKENQEMNSKKEEEIHCGHQFSFKKIF